MNIERIAHSLLHALVSVTLLGAGGGVLLMVLDHERSTDSSFATSCQVNSFSERTDQTASSITRCAAGLRLAAHAQPALSFAVATTAGDITAVTTLRDSI